MLRLTCLFLLAVLPSLTLSQAQWKVDQPHRYVIYNGEYVSLDPPAEDSSTSPSFLSSLNPFNAFTTMWASLPSLNPFKGSEEGSEVTESGLPPGMLLAEDAEPSWLGPDGMGGLGMGLGAISALMGGSSFMKRSDGPPAKPKDTGPVKIYYRPYGQGGFTRYEVPIHMPDELLPALPAQENPFPYPNEDHKMGNGHKRPLFGHLNKLPLTKPFYGQGNPSTPPHAARKAGDTKTKTEDPFPCPKTGQWTYDGNLCTALIPFPRWACKPIDIVTSGRIVVCRNKVKPYTK